MCRFAPDTDYEVLPNVDGLGGEAGRLKHVCRSCGETHFLDVEPGKLVKWIESPEVPHVQEFWPEVSPELREEFFISGICAKCWQELFKEEEGEA